MTPSQLRFFQRFLQDFFESVYVHGLLTSATHTKLSRWCRKGEVKPYAQKLFDDGTVETPDYHLSLRLIRLREMDGKSFDHIQVSFIPEVERRRARCFVGHRFSPPICRTLRWNLRQILEPYNVELDWSGRDIRSVQILDDLVNRIRKADFCVFDNRATKGRPNVYIEAGICFALKKPFILFEHKPHSRSTHDPGPVPSDLGYALALPYKCYRQLFRDFYLRLPLFFSKNVRKNVR